MPTYQSPTPNVPAALLAAGLALARIHGSYYARCFLEENGIDSSVITELLDVGRPRPPGCASSPQSSH
jgi:hypothetical protein